MNQSADITWKQSGKVICNEMLCCAEVHIAIWSVVWTHLKAVVCSSELCSWVTLLFFSEAVLVTCKEATVYGKTMEAVYVQHHWEWMLMQALLFGAFPLNTCLCCTGDKSLRFSNVCLLLCGKLFYLISLGRWIAVFVRLCLHRYRVLI